MVKQGAFNQCWLRFDLRYPYIDIVALLHISIKLAKGGRTLVDQGVEPQSFGPAANLLGTWLLLTEVSKLIADAVLFKPASCFFNGVTIFDAKYYSTHDDILSY